ncbi:MAG: IPT/TIG domain-containing protein [Myxococcota bacterium]|nr:IPT/TIG domain-containing protein [Myxococcota bacterium]
MVDVSVLRPDGQQIVAFNSFLYTSAEPGLVAPLLASVSPAVGPVGGDTLVEIHGAHLQANATVWFGAGVASEVTWVDDTLLVARSPAGQEGSVSITVSHDDGGSGVLPGAFTYYTPAETAAPTVFSATPFQGSALGGDTVSIGGNGFQPGVAVFICGAKAVVTESTAATAIVLTNPGPLGPCNVEVVNPDGLAASLEAGFKYIPATPVIANVLPASGPVTGGISVVLHGEGFMDGASVRFGAADAESVDVWSTVSIQAVAPAGLAGTTDVTVVNPGGVAATAADAFTYLDEVIDAVPPTIEALFPTAGSVDGGTPVEVLGSGFKEGLTVLLGGVVIESVALMNDTTLQLVTPSGTAGPVALTILNTDGLGATKPAAFTYLNEVQAAPALLGISPTSGPQTGGTTVTISGENLSEGGQLYLGGLPLISGVVVGDAVATGVTPPGPAGPADLSWVGADGQHVTLAGAFDYVAGPTLSSVEPTLGAMAGGEVISIFGTNMNPAVSILFDEEPAQVLSVDDGFVVVAVAPGSAWAGWIDIAAVNPDGQLAVLTDAFRYLAPPGLATLSPAHGPSEGGTPVQIVGAGLVEGTRVHFGDVEASAVGHISDELLVATAPSHAVGPVDVRIEDPVGQVATLEGGFVFTNVVNLAPAPQAQQLTPTTGPVDGGVIVTVFGEGFQPGAVILFGDTPGLDGATAGDGIVSATLPPQQAGEVTVTVVNPDGQISVTPESFTYEAELALSPPPALTAVDPTIGPTAGGNLVNIYGAGFAEGIQVRFGDAVAPTVTVLSEVELQVAAPANTAGLVDVSVISADGQQVTLTDAYTVAPPPVLVGLVPNSASALGGSLVTLSGGSFIGGTGGEAQSTVLLCDDFNGDAGCVPAVPEDTTVSADGTELSFVAPPHTPGTVDVAVVNPDGQWDALLQSFVYNPLPTLSQVSPGITSTLGGATLTVTGSGFQQGVQVSMGGSDCTEVLVTTSESLNCNAPPQTPGPKDVTVTNPDGGEASLEDGITYVLPPTLTGLTPANGAEAGGYQVTLQGSGFVDSAPGSIVRFGTTLVAPEDTEVVSPLLIVVTVPEGTGLVSVSVDNPDGQKATLTDAFFYVPPVPAPVLSTIVPSSGLTSGGYITQLVGTGFLEGATVSFGQNEIWTDALDVEIKNGGTLITMVAPPGEPGVAAVRVTNTDGQVGIIPGFFEYISPEVTDALSVGAIAPATGLLNGGTNITVTGSGFAPGIYVQFGEDPNWSDGDTVRLGPTLLRVTVPSAPTGLSGPVDVRITNPTPVPEIVIVEDGYTYTGGAVFTTFDGDRLPPEPNHDLNAQIADVNGDGHNDVFVFRNGSSMQHKSARLMLNVPDEEDTTGWFERVWTWEGISNLRVIYDAALGDMDEDGDLDAILTSYSDSLWYCRNDGTSAWSCSQLQDQNCSSTDVEVADLNCDGHLDIVLARYSESPSCDNEVWVGDGMGLFFRQDDLLPAHFEHTNAIRAADVDLDGDLDLLVANGDAMQNRLYYSNCNNVARPPSCFDPPEGCEVVVNGDSTYAVCENTTYNYAGARARCHLAGMDVLQINDEDEAAFFDTYNREFWIDYSDAIEEGIHVWGTPSNTYEDWCTNEPNDQGGTEDCAEFDPAGTNGCMNDISCTTSRRWVCEIPSVVPQCTEPWAIADALYGAGKNFPISGGNTKDVALVDIDINGFVDAIVGNDGQQTNVYMNYGGSFALDTGLQWPQDGDSAIEEIHPTDIDLDGDVDLVVLSGESIRVYVNDHMEGGANSFTEETATRLPADPARGDIISLAIGDLDSDLHPDIYVVNEHLSDRILLNRGYPNTPWVEEERMPSGHFALNTQMRLPETDTEARDLTFADIDDDGDQDLVKCNFGSPLAVHVNQGNGYFTDESDTRVDFAVYECAERGLELADMDGDGDLDIVVDQIYEDCNDGYCNGAPVLLLNDGLGVFSVSEHSNFGSAGWQSRGMSILDLDGDGDLDLATANIGSNNVSALFNNGKGAFAKAVTFPAGKGPFFLAAADLDGDGVDEWVTSPATGYLPDWHTDIWHREGDNLTLQSSHPGVIPTLVGRFRQGNRTTSRGSLYPVSTVLEACALRWIGLSEAGEVVPLPL